MRGNQHKKINRDTPIVFDRIYHGIFVFWIEQIEVCFRGYKGNCITLVFFTLKTPYFTAFHKPYLLNLYPCFACTFADTAPVFCAVHIFCIRNSILLCFPLKQSLCRRQYRFLCFSVLQAQYTNPYLPEVRRF